MRTPLIVRWHRRWRWGVVTRYQHRVFLTVTGGPGRPYYRCATCGWWWLP